MKTLSAIAAVLLGSATVAGAATITVTELNLGTDGGVGYPQNTNPTLAEATAAISTVGDGSFVALGTGGSLTFSLDMAVTDGSGNDISFFDGYGFSEGLTVEASSNGVDFVSLGSDPGNPFGFCSTSSPCESGFDLSGSGLTDASFFRVSASGLIVVGFPEAYDFDGIEILNMAPIPLPASLPLLAIGLGGLAIVRRRTSSQG